MFPVICVMKCCNIFFSVVKVKCITYLHIVSYLPISCSSTGCSRLEVSAPCSPPLLLGSPVALFWPLVAHRIYTIFATQLHFWHLTDVGNYQAVYTQQLLRVLAKEPSYFSSAKKICLLAIFYFRTLFQNFKVEPHCI